MGDLEKEIVKSIIQKSLIDKIGGLAQLARAPALQAGGHRFDSDILHCQAPKPWAKVSKQKVRTKGSGRNDRLSGFT